MVKLFSETKILSRNWRSTAAAVLVGLMGLSGLSAMGLSSAHAAGNMVPDYEVKLLMNPNVVLDTDHKLKNTLLSTFNMSSSVTKMNVLFMDTNGKDIYNNTWIARIRKTEGENGFELTYKKRYPIDNGNITEALYRAYADGFDSSEKIMKLRLSGGIKRKP